MAEVLQEFPELTTSVYNAEKKDNEEVRRTVCFSLVVSNDRRRAWGFDPNTSFTLHRR
jgi:hypothetical protein